MGTEVLLWSLRQAEPRLVAQVWARQDWRNCRDREYTLSGYEAEQHQGQPGCVPKPIRNQRGTCPKE